MRRKYRFRLVSFTALGARISLSLHLQVFPLSYSRWGESSSKAYQQLLWIVLLCFPSSHWYLLRLEVFGSQNQKKMKPHEWRARGSCLWQVHVQTVISPRLWYFFVALAVAALVDVSLRVCWPKRKGRYSQAAEDKHCSLVVPLEQLWTHMPPNSAQRTRNSAEVEMPSSAGKLCLDCCAVLWSPECCLHTYSSVKSRLD